MKPLWEYYTVRCKCQLCGRAQVRKVNDIVAGKECCLGRIGHSCGGPLEVYSDGPEDAQLNANNVLGYINTTLGSLFKGWPIRNEERFATLLDTVVDDLSTWTAPIETPQQMGWVGQNGLP